MFFVYILRCADGSLYIGHSHDPAAREFWHNQGAGSAFTAARRPVSIVYTERHATRIEATARERQLKRWTRAKKEALVAGDLVRLKRL